MNNRIIFILTIMILSVFCPLYAAYEVRIRDITYIKGIKKNIVSGYGLVVGLDGTGDSRNTLTEKTINQYLAHNGVESASENLLTKNAAVVAVTAEIDGFLKKGDLVDIQTASLGNAKSIDNGLLLQTVLRAADKNIYIVAAGIVSSGQTDNVNKRRGMVSSGGIVERAAGTQDVYLERNNLTLVLKQGSIGAASLIRQAITEEDNRLQAEIVDYKQVQLSMRDGSELKYETIALVLELTVEIETAARVIIDKQTGVVVAGNNVRIDSAFISLPGVNVSIDKKEKIHGALSGNSTVSELATAFNNLGVSPEEVVSVFMALKKCGSLNAEIIVQ